MIKSMNFPKKISIGILAVILILTAFFFLFSDTTFREKVIIWELNIKKQKHRKKVLKNIDSLIVSNIKDRLPDPESYIDIGTTVIDSQGKLILYKDYKCKNAFNATLKKRVKFVFDSSSKKVDIFEER